MTPRPQSPFSLRWERWFGCVVLALLLSGCAKEEKDAEREKRRGMKKKGTEAAAPAATPRPEVEAIRNMIPGGQVLLADAPPFAEGTGWDRPDFSHPTERVTAWTLGDHQTLEWDGPANPGAYKMIAKFHRTHPFPEKEIKVEYLAPLASDWAAAPCSGEGPFQIEAAFETKLPNERLRAEFKIPSWIPAELIPDSKDPRKLGMLFLRIEIHPAAPGEAATAPSAEAAPAEASKSEEPKTEAAEAKAGSGEAPAAEKAEAKKSEPEAAPSKKKRKAAK